MTDEYLFSEQYYKDMKEHMEISFQNYLDEVIESYERELKFDEALDEALKKEGK